MPWRFIKKNSPNHKKGGGVKASGIYAPWDPANGFSLIQNIARAQGITDAATLGALFWDPSKGKSISTLIREAGATTVSDPWDPSKGLSLSDEINFISPPSPSVDFTVSIGYLDTSSAIYTQNFEAKLDGIEACFIYTYINDGYGDFIRINKYGFFIINNGLFYGISNQPDKPFTNQNPISISSLSSGSYDVFFYTDSSDKRKFTFGQLTISNNTSTIGNKNSYIIAKNMYYWCDQYSGKTFYNSIFPDDSDIITFPFLIDSTDNTFFYPTNPSPKTPLDQTKEYYIHHFGDDVTGKTLFFGTYAYSGSAWVFTQSIFGPLGGNSAPSDGTVGQGVDLTKYIYAPLLYQTNTYWEPCIIDIQNKKFYFAFDNINSLYGNAIDPYIIGDKNVLALKLA